MPNRDFKFFEDEVTSYYRTTLESVYPELYQRLKAGDSAYFRPSLISNESLFQLLRQWFTPAGEALMDVTAERPWVGDTIVVNSYDEWAAFYQEWEAWDEKESDK